MKAISKLNNLQVQHRSIVWRKAGLFWFIDLCVQFWLCPFHQRHCRAAWKAIRDRINVCNGIKHRGAKPCSGDNKNRFLCYFPADVVCRDCVVEVCIVGSGNDVPGFLNGGHLMMGEPGDSLFLGPNWSQCASMSWIMCPKRTRIYTHTCQRKL